jgi:hypothetical protein
VKCKSIYWITVCACLVMANTTRADSQANPPAQVGGIENPQRTIQELRKAAGAGDAVAMNNIGTLYYSGQGLPQDYRQAMTWYRKSADRRNTSSMCCIGALYASGKGVAQDYQQAMTWWLKAADAGDTYATCCIGALYANGQGVAQDYQQAMTWYRKAADAGNADAMNNIGVLYEEGHGGGLDNQRAMAWAWYRKAADAGNTIAQNRLADFGSQPPTNQTFSASPSTNSATHVAMSGASPGQTAGPSTQADHQTQESVVAAAIVADDDRLIAAVAAQAAAQQVFDTDVARARDLLVDDICGADADIAADRITLFLQDPTENGKRKWSHPEAFPSATSAMTVWCAADVDVINVRDFWFVIDGEGAVHVSATKPNSLDLSKASTKWDYLADEHVHVDVFDLVDRIDRLHKMIHLAAAAYPKDADEFYSWTILFQSERAHYTPTAWDESRQDYVGGDTTEATVNDYPVAENGSYYGEISTVNGLPRTHYVNGYYRSDGTYVRSYYRSR